MSVWQHYLVVMPRNVRCVLPGLACHVIRRGANRQRVFLTATDRSTYLRLLKCNLADAEARIWPPAQSFCSKERAYKNGSSCGPVLSFQPVPMLRCSMESATSGSSTPRSPVRRRYTRSRARPGTSCPARRRKNRNHLVPSGRPVRAPGVAETRANQRNKTRWEFR